MRSLQFLWNFITILGIVSCATGAGKILLNFQTLPVREIQYSKWKPVKDSFMRESCVKWSKPIVGKLQTCLEKKPEYVSFPDFEKADMICTGREYFYNLIRKSL